MGRFVLVLVILLLILMTQTVYGEADGPDYWMLHGVASDDVLNIRKEPDWRSQKIGAIPPEGQCIRNLECVGGLTFEEFTTLSEAEKETIRKKRPRWCRVEYRGIAGWVAGRYLREGACPSE